jgi:hypothetical protein
VDVGARPGNAEVTSGWMGGATGGLGRRVVKEFP